ncbi:MAG: putative entry exclusion protein TrbK-alt [Rhizobiaceae bacterium]|nr:putative entry exclusion protein TrbK-alt [Rhizobiaceae bacterium]
MESKTLARIAAVAFVAVAITASVVEASRKAPVPLDTSVTAATIPAADPLHDELTHCQLLGQAGASDADCLRAWSENRRRFLTPGSRPQPSPAAPAPTAEPNNTEAQ